MTKRKSEKDIISESTYNKEMTDISANPEGDSPGDSETDAEKEFSMGLNYFPKSDVEAESLPKVPSERRGIKSLPKDSMLVSSESPSPWQDLDAPSDTH